MNFPDGRSPRRSNTPNTTGYPELPINVIHFGDYENLLRHTKPLGIKPTLTQNLILGKTYIIRNNQTNIIYRGIMAIPMVAGWDLNQWDAAYVFQTTYGDWYGIAKNFTDELGGLLSIKSTVTFNDIKPRITEHVKEKIFKKRANEAYQIYHYSPESKYMRNIIQEKEASGSYSHPDLIDNWELDESGSRKRRKFEFGNKSFIKKLKKDYNFLKKHLNK